MTEQIRKKLSFLKAGSYQAQRRAPRRDAIRFPDGTTEYQVNAMLLQEMLEQETPRLYENDRFGFNRTIKKTPVGLVGDRRFTSSIGNITIDYPYVLQNGMDRILERIDEKRAVCEDAEKRELYDAMRDSVTACLQYADRYRDYAREQGAAELYAALCHVPHGGATSFYEACVMLKFLQFTLRCNRNMHLTLGGFDRYMRPYFEADLAAGASEDALFEVLEDFFITLNLDSDTYFGVQKGDNGMSMVLGGRDRDGRDCYCRLSELCILAARELCLIDPKINLRVDRSTPLSRLELATELTKKGLGFPQYCNDDVVIPGLIRLGYAPEDACNYTVAACWEFIIPGKSFDIPNLDRVNFPLAVERAVNEDLLGCATFEDFLVAVRRRTEEECRAVAERMLVRGPIQNVSPYLSVFVSDCIERGLDVSQGGAIYNAYGAHGVGISSAADAIAAVKQVIFDEKTRTAEELLRAIGADFRGFAELRNELLAAPKMGNDDDAVDRWADLLMECFENVFSQYRNCYGAQLRPGTGSAMEYIFSAATVGATADGRHAHAPFGCSFSPSPTARLNGPLSCIRSFTKHDLLRIINGGPLTMEIHGNVFRNADGVKKVAALVKAFIDRGGHQLQLNAVSRDTLLDAQEHPEAHRDLIVRVWGWSGYFNELDPEYREHIISRTEFGA